MCALLGATQKHVKRTAQQQKKGGKGKRILSFSLPIPIVKRVDLKKIILKILFFLNLYPTPPSNPT